jgi:hypothetical protein
LVLAPAAGWATRNKKTRRGPGCSSETWLAGLFVLLSALFSALLFPALLLALLFVVAVLSDLTGLTLITRRVQGVGLIREHGILQTEHSDNGQQAGAQNKFRKAAFHGVTPPDCAQRPKRSMAEVLVLFGPDGNVTPAFSVFHWCECRESKPTGANLEKTKFSL